MIIQPLLGLALFILLAWLLSENRRRFPLRLVLGGLALQLLLALLLLRLPGCRQLFWLLNQAVLALEQATAAGTGLVFGYLGGGPLPFAETGSASAYLLAFRGLPLVLLISALSALLFYWRILPWVVQGLSWLLRRTLGLGGAEGLAVAANIFVGMVEAPLIVRPYLARMSRSELFCLMSCGMATIAGTVMVLYASILRPLLPDIMGHILTASLISAPAAVVIAKVLVPENATPIAARLEVDTSVRGSMDAITRGTTQGIQLLLNIVAMIIVMVALVALVNQLLGLLWPGASLQGLLGQVLAPVVWLFGVPWAEAPTAAALLGTKTVINEFVAYLDMSRLPPGQLSERSLYLLSYALCGFANPGSLGILIGGLGAMAPERRPEIVSLGLKSLLAGTLATCMTAAVAALLLPA